MYRIKPGLYLTNLLYDNLDFESLFIRVGFRLLKVHTCMFIEVAVKNIIFTISVYMVEHLGYGNNHYS